MERSVLQAPIFETQTGTPAGMLVGALFAVLLGAAPALALPAEKSVSQYARRAWTAEHSLAITTAGSIAETPDGYLWLATYKGLVRFDGVRFKTFTKADFNVLPSDWMSVLGTDRSGRLWIGLEGAVAVMEDGGFRVYGAAEGFPAGLVSAFYADRRNRLWVGSSSGLSVLDGDTVKTHVLAGGEVYDLAAAADDGVWVVTSGGVVLWRGGRAEQVLGFTAGPGGRRLPGRTARAATVDDEGVLWVGTDAGLARIGADGVEVFDRRNGLPADLIQKIREDEDGNLWLATNAGLFRGRGGLFERLEWSAMLPSDQVADVFLDHQGQLWVASQGFGLLRLTSGRVTSYAMEGGAWAVVPEGGGLWTGSAAGVFRRHEGKVEKVWSDAGVTSLLRDRRGALWAGTSAGLFRRESGALQWIPWKPPGGLPGRTILALAETRDGTVWVGARGGLGALAPDGRWTLYGLPDGLPSRTVRVFLEDRAGTFWIGTTAGLCRWRDGRVEVAFDKSRGLASDLVLALHEDDGGTLWIGTDGGGLARVRPDGTLRLYGAADGLPELTVYSILEDGLGGFWSHGNYGIYRLSRDALDRLDRDATAESLKPLVLGPADGLLNRQGNGGVQSPAAVGPDGNLWFAMIGGLARVDPRDVGLPPPPPPRVEEVTIDGVRAGVGPAVTVPSDHERLEVRFTVPDTAYGERLRFRYRLDRVNSGWVDVGERRVAHFTFLPPGRLVFRVAVRREDGPWFDGTDETGELTLVVEPAFYQTFWFYALVTLGLLVVGRGLHQLRVRRLLRSNRELRQTQRALKARHAELDQLTYALSHEMRTPLVTLQGFAGLLSREVGEDTGLRDGVEKIKGAAHDMEQILDALQELRDVHVDSNVWGVLSLTAVARAAVAALGERLDGVEVVVEGGMPEVHNVAGRLEVVFERLLDNAAKFMGEEPSPRITVKAREVDGEVLCRIRDNGIGIDPRYLGRIFNLFEQLDRDAPGTGLGLALVRRIVEDHDGRVWAESQGAGQGTTICLALPTANASFRRFPAGD